MNIKTYVEASSRLSIGLTNNGLDVRQAATVRIGPKHWKIVPRTSICRYIRTLFHFVPSKRTLASLRSTGRVDYCKTISQNNQTKNYILILPYVSPKQ